MLIVNVHCTDIRLGPDTPTDPLAINDQTAWTGARDNRGGNAASLDVRFLVSSNIDIANNISSRLIPKEL